MLSKIRSAYVLRYKHARVANSIALSFYVLQNFNNISVTILSAVSVLFYPNKARI